MGSHSVATRIVLSFRATRLFEELAKHSGNADRKFRMFALPPSWKRQQEVNLTLRCSIQEQFSRNVPARELNLAPLAVCVWIRERTCSFWGEAKTPTMLCGVYTRQLGCMQNLIGGRILALLHNCTVCLHMTCAHHRIHKVIRRTPRCR